MGLTELVKVKDGDSQSFEFSHRLLHVLTTHKRRSSALGLKILPIKKKNKTWESLNSTCRNLLLQYFIASFISTGLGSRSSITNAFMLICFFFKPGVDSKLCAC